MYPPKQVTENIERPPSAHIAVKTYVMMIYDQNQVVVLSDLGPVKS